MHKTVAALTFCKFEATHDAYDQMVLCNILQTLVAALACRSARYLSDADVCSMFEAAYLIGFDRQIVPYLSGALPLPLLPLLLLLLRTIRDTCGHGNGLPLQISGRIPQPVWI